MNVIETRLAGHQATMKHITRLINRHLGGMQLARVELSFSTQSAERLVPEAAKKSIAVLLREHGMGTALVSVRPHDGPIDDASGDHVVRLFPSQRGDASVLPRSGLMTWLSRWFPSWFGPVHPRATVATQAATPVAPVKPPSLSNAAAVGHLREAVNLACAYIETDAGTAMVMEPGSTQLIGSAHVVVRLDYLHAVLGPMLQGHAQQTTKSIGDMVRAKGLTLAPTFDVSYAYQPRVAVIGTSYANETDVEVVLRQRGSTPQRVEPTLDATVVETAMPGGTLTPAQQVVPVLTVRVLGTLVAGALQHFEQAFDVPLAALPARLDRTALAAAGFGRAHPGLLAVASNSCPLVFIQGDDGGVRLQAGTRATSHGGSLPMYYRADTLAPLRGEERLGIASLRVVVNDPAGVVDGTTGKTLPALVVELRCGA